ncbi:hypothetical protein CEP52_014106 [Fusarium oligoseptatum]|uniref:Uncharacterized protein n=1 Tax=Fusarium oligoseptatum TaxID=2604345 RepID=A0A428SQA6_9HYPO|nr:hypothetical protein CEP52_014106 [Fusarium oligoseptatum]
MSGHKRSFIKAASLIHIEAQRDKEFETPQRVPHRLAGNSIGQVFLELFISLFPSFTNPFSCAVAMLD